MSTIGTRNGTRNPHVSNAWRVMVAASTKKGYGCPSDGSAKKLDRNSSAALRCGFGRASNGLDYTVTLGPGNIAFSARRGSGEAVGRGTTELGVRLAVRTGQVTHPAE